MYVYRDHDECLVIEEDGLYWYTITQHDINDWCNNTHELWDDIDMVLVEVLVPVEIFFNEPNLWRIE